ncbi:uncharacterized protein LOC21391308 [Morus notabilis]|uniref:uncharacterized protein LOC21391308 n=1 Tax=Morus notabilis TaxID=981085 RepID=UPI000CED203B|nr:uncharacterized protein LOC21391308 [Morus notabilis]
MEDIVPEAEAKDHEDHQEGSSNHFLPKVICGMGSGEEREDEKKRGGVMSHLISNFVSPPSPKAAQNGEVQNGVFVSKSEEDVGNHGGIMNNLISKLFNHSEDVKQGDDEGSSEKKKVDKGRKKEENEEESGDNIVSHFPTSIPDDAVPTTDEAFILIHSIVKD